MGRKLGRKLGKVEEAGFYGLTDKGLHLPGYKIEIRKGTMKGLPYAYIVYIQNGRIEWKITPKHVSERNKRPHDLVLYRRDSKGRLNGLEAKQYEAWSTPRGLREVVNYARKKINREIERYEGRFEYLEEAEFPDEFANRIKQDLLTPNS